MLHIIRLTFQWFWEFAKFVQKVCYKIVRRVFNSLKSYSIYSDLHFVVFLFEIQCTAVRPYSCTYIEFYLNNAVLVATTPNCTVDKESAKAGDNVTYTCSASRVCPSISISLTIENSGNTVASDSNNDEVTWTTQADNIANSMVTCMSTIRCPSVSVTGELIALYL